MTAVGRDLPHDSARGHVSGQSQFIDDLPPLHGELHVGYVGSPVAHGRLRAIDLAAARAVPGAVALLTAVDIPGHNKFGPIVPDEHLLVDTLAEFLGDPVVIVAAENRAALAAARRAVRVDVDPLAAVLTIDQAIERGQFLGPARTIARGDSAAALAAAEHVLRGELVIGGQDHFYLESHAAQVVPGERRTLTVHASTQHPSEVQAVVAEVCDLPFNHVTVVARRMGGGFGGKETQGAQPAAMAALVALRTGRPARIVLSKDDDMCFTGKRHPFKSCYRIGFTSTGEITAWEVDLFSNGGCTTDLSPSVLERAMLHSDNAYYVPNVRITGRVCKTHLPSNTAFRGFGGPQGVLGIENALEEVAAHLGLDALDVRQRNCYGVGQRNVAPYGQIVENNTLPELFATLRRSSGYDRRRAEIAAHNRQDRGTLRGLSLTAVKFGISFTKQHLNQANALVNLYLDGTALVTTGGTEMGQGVNTRVAQLVADELGIGYERVLVGATNTDKNNNTSPTAASSGTDLNGAAAVRACAVLRARLAAVAAEALADASAGLPPSPENIVFADDRVWDNRRPAVALAFAQLVQRAYQARISLGERGFYATPGVDFNRETGQGHPFLYYTNGVAAAEVCIDRFTGELRVARVDLLMDIGRPINPGLDRGQIIGGFIQGMGWCTTEELKYGPGGELLSHSPTTYKIPNIGDLPETLLVDTLDNPHSDRSLKGSKAVGEPPLLLGLCAWTAVKDALRQASGGQVVPLALPATGEEILMRLSGLPARAASPSTADR